ncbi:hypothetical protein JCM3774_000678 [Rhodotorula dairenensis]
MPWLIAVTMGGLAFGSLRGWVASRDHLPTYMQGPALIGGICCILAGIACIVAFFLVNKGEKHWTKQKNRRANDLDSHTHPLDNWPHWLVFGTAIAAVVTEGAFLYMIICVLLSKGNGDYCFIFDTGDKVVCNGGDGLSWVFVLGLILVIAVGSALWFEKGMQASIGRFNHDRQWHAQRRQYNPTGGMDGSSGGQYDQFGNADDDGNEKRGGDDYYDDRDDGVNSYGSRPPSYKSGSW